MKKDLSASAATGNRKQFKGLCTSENPNTQVKTIGKKATPKPGLNEKPAVEGSSVKKSVTKTESTSNCKCQGLKTKTPLSSHSLGGAHSQSKEETGRKCMQHLDSYMKCKYVRYVRCNEWERENRAQMEAAIEKWKTVESMKDELFVKKLRLEKLRLDRRMREESLKLSAENQAESFQSAFESSVRMLKDVTNSVVSASNRISIPECTQEVEKQIFNELSSEL
mmetsp:Transcript_15315/g.18964  ORF Transcript_15315/g.18964 Transcript_15315/m.18964 type:complete len:223 (+) Transcript_15315:261-929(+)